MGSLLSSKTKTSQTNSVAVPKEYQAALDDLMSKFKSAAEIPFQEYQGQRVEDLSGREQTAFSRIDGMQDKYNPLMQLAMSQAMEAGDGYGPEDVDKFINPYTQYVINNSKERFQEDYEKRLLGARGDAARSGSFGNSRLGLVEGTLGSEFLKGSRELQYGGLRDAFDRAMSNMLGFNQDKRQGLASILNTVQQGQNIDYRNIDALAGAGRQERAIGQAGRDFDAQEFLRRIQDPQQKTAFLAQGVYNYPRELFTRNSNSTTTQTMSPVQAAIGIGSVAASFANPLSGLSGLFSNPTAGAASGPPTALMPHVQAAPMGTFYQPQQMTGWGNSGMPSLYAKGGLIRGYKKGGLVKKYKEGGEVGYAGIKNILDMISKAESNYKGNPYDSAFGGPDKYRSLTNKKGLSQLTLKELLEVQPKFTKELGSSAAGKYQIMNDTLQGLMKEMKLSGDEKFDNSMQDRLALQLLKRRGLDDYLSGKMSKKQFQDSIANEWAGLPDSKGKSPYKGVGLNKGPTVGKDFISASLDQFKKMNSREKRDMLKGMDSLRMLAGDARDSVDSGFKNLLLALNSERSDAPTGREISNPIYSDAGEMRSEGFDKTLPTGFNRDNLQNAQFAVDLEGLMEQDIPAELLDDSATASLTDLGRKRQLLNLAQRSREDDRLTKEATRAYDILDSGDYAAEEEGFLKRMTRAPFANKEPLPEPPKFYKDINLEKYAQNPLVALLEENPSVMGNILYNLRERPKQDEKMDGYAEGGTVMGNQYYNLSNPDDLQEDDILPIMGNQFYNHMRERPPAPYPLQRNDYNDGFVIPEKRTPSFNIPENINVQVGDWQGSSKKRLAPHEMIRQGLAGLMDYLDPTEEKPLRKLPFTPEKIAQQKISLENPFVQAAAGQLGDMSTGGYGEDTQQATTPAASKHEKTVDLSIQNLMKMAGVEPPKEEEQDTILGFGYDKDLMRFGLALLAAGPGKAGAQAIGEAGQALLAGKESDKAKKKASQQEYLKELSTKLGLMTQGEKLLNPDSEFTDIARKLGLQDESYAKRLGMQENMQRRLLEAKRNATREEQNALKLRIEALKAAAAAGNMQAQEALARIGMGIGENEAVSTPEDDGETLGN